LSRVPIDGPFLSEESCHYQRHKGLIYSYFNASSHDRDNRDVGSASEHHGWRGRRRNFHNVVAWDRISPLAQSACSIFTMWVPISGHGRIVSYFLLDWFIFLIGILGGGVQFGPFGTAATNRPIVPTPGDYDNGEIGGMMIRRGNRSTRRKPALVPLCPPQTPHAVRTWTRSAAVGNQRLTAWATAWPCLIGLHFDVKDRWSMFLRNVGELLPHYRASNPTG
jgi:hypothetical protein